MALHSFGVAKPPPWIAAGALLNSWTGSLYYRLTADAVHLELLSDGLLVNGGGAQFADVFQLPAGYFTQGKIRYFIGANTTLGTGGFCAVTATGALRINSAAGNAWMLQGVALPLDR